MNLSFYEESPIQVTSLLKLMDLGFGHCHGGIFHLDGFLFQNSDLITKTTKNLMIGFMIFFCGDILV